VKRHFCGSCGTTFPSNEELPKVCAKCKTEVDRKNLYITVPIQSALQAQYNRPSYADHSRYISNRLRQPRGRYISDIVDGSVVRGLHQQGWWQPGATGDVGIIGSTDGIPLFVRSGIGVWPIQNLKRTSSWSLLLPRASSHGSFPPRFSR
jgi:hypothetical protein